MFSMRKTVALNYEETESHPEKVSNIKPFINKYNWKGINYPSKRRIASCSKKTVYTIKRNNITVVFIAWIGFTLLEQKINLNLMKKYVKITIFCGIVISSEKINILDFNHYMKSDKMPFIIYADTEYSWAYSLWIFDVNNLGTWSHNTQKIQLILKI